MHMCGPKQRSMQGNYYRSLPSQSRTLTHPKARRIHRCLSFNGPAGADHPTSPYPKCHKRTSLPPLSVLFWPQDPNVHQTTTPVAISPVVAIASIATLSDSHRCLTAADPYPRCGNRKNPNVRVMFHNGVWQDIRYPEACLAEDPSQA